MNNWLVKAYQSYELSLRSFVNSHPVFYIPHPERRLYQINFLRVGEQCDVNDVTALVDGPRTRRVCRNINRYQHIRRLLKFKSNNRIRQTDSTFKIFRI